MQNPNAGIIYPKDFQLMPLNEVKPKEDLKYFTVPHKAWDLCQNELNDVFAQIKYLSPDYVFVLAPLHKGKVFFDDSFKVYSYEDCFVEHELIEKNDDVCSEEYSYEMLIPYFETYLKNSKTTALFAPEANSKLKDLITFLKKNYNNSVFIISTNSNCAEMWTKVF